MIFSEINFIISYDFTMIFCEPATANGGAVGKIAACGGSGPGFDSYLTLTKAKKKYIKTERNHLCDLKAITRLESSWFFFVYLQITQMITFLSRDSKTFL